MFTLAACQVFCLALVLAWVHRVVARHGYCSTHGKLIHLAMDQKLPPSSPQQSVHHDSHLSGIHGCLALTFLMTPWVRPQGFRSAASIMDLQRSDVAINMKVVPSIPLLHRAPKVSPPKLISCELGFPGA